MKRILIGLLLAVLTLLAATGLGLGLIHVTDFPYSADIKALRIVETSGLDRQEIMANYNAMMDFISPFSHEEFDLPTLKFSENGKEHFEDCKPIFNGVYIAGAISLLLMAIMFVFKLVDKISLRYSGILTLTIPILLCGIMAVNFDRAFVVFHKVFFNSDTWIFYPNVDEIINILPADFFMHCAIFIAAFWVIAALTEIILSTNGTKIK